MSIMPDSFFLKERENIIKPFSDGNVKKALSYGVSSYGYDISAADEWKVFTNINNTIVDPKNFNEESLVNVSGKGYCIIPPNSFALARSREYIKVPRNMLVLCIGKSTYARCFTGDTKLLLNNSIRTFKQIYEDLQNKRIKSACGIGYTLESGVYRNVEFLQVRKLPKEKVVEVIYSNGDTNKCTPDHEFLTTYEEWVEAKDLKGKYICNIYEEDIQVIDIKDAGEEEVYCCTTLTGNYVLSTGIVVHNCGIIANITPLEPEWEGHITLEFSNTTPLPAKLYPNEGIVQLLFFKAEEECIKSYKDKKGKYQNQTGITLPKTGLNN